MSAAPLESVVDPETHRAPPEPSVGADGLRTYRDAVFSILQGFRPLHLDVRVPPREGPRPLVVWVHGGGWWHGSRLELPETIAPVGFAERFLARGYALADVDYRLSGEASFPAPLHDVKAALRWLRAYAGVLGVDPDRIAVMGESGGGHLAALVGLVPDAAEPVEGIDLEGATGVQGVSSGVRAVVDWYGVHDIEAILVVPGAAMEVSNELAWLLGGAVAERRREARVASPVRHVHPGAPPFLCQHGTADVVVPYSQSEELAAALRAQGVRCDLQPVPGADHCFEGCPDIPGLVETSLDFLDDVLR